MTTDMPLIPAIQWHEGMLLSPQHFQQQDLRLAQLLHHHLQLIAPFHWGIEQLKFDAVLLPTGVIRLLDFQGVMPDGYIFSHQFVYPTQTLEIDLSPLQDQLPKEGITLYLAIPEQTLGSSSIQGEWPRYVSSEGAEILDDNSPDNSVRIPRLLPRIKLLAAHSAPSKYTSIPIGRVVFQEEAFMLARYTPPHFKVTPTSLLGQRCASLAQRMREKAAYLSDKWQGQVGTPLSFETTQQLQPLVQSLPRLEALIRSGNQHPYSLFLELCTIAGRLAGLRLAQVPPVFPQYDHNEIETVFEPIFQWIHATLDNIERTHSLVVFDHRDRVFFTHLYPYMATQTLLVGLKTPASMTMSEMEDWMKEAIIATESFVETARLRRVTGVERHLLTTNQLTDLLPGRGVIVFSIPFQESFMKVDETLCIFNPADTPSKRPVEIILYQKTNGPEVFKDPAYED